MFACVLIFILLLPAACIPLAIDDLNAHDELAAMGIHLENQPVV